MDKRQIYLCTKNTCIVCVMETAYKSTCMAQKSDGASVGKRW